MKAFGEEIIQFYNDWPFGEGWTHDSEFDIDDGYGNTDLVRMVKYDVEQVIGEVSWEGNDCDEPTSIQVNGRVVQVSYNFVAKVFKAWRSTDVQVLITVPANKLDALKLFAKENGWKVAK